MDSLEINSKSRTEFIDITAKVEDIVRKSGVKSGICYLFVPHTTAGITINENADPGVVVDILKELNKIIPFKDGYLHSEGNADAHIKSTIVGTSLNIFIEDSRLVLGTWQGIFFCEFDGPRRRKVFVKVIAHLFSQ
ncbi:MAG: secondary thiamine-phosphate synthase enzyme YjbQ [bacterium]